MNTINNKSNVKTGFSFTRVILLTAKTAILIIIAIKLWFWPLVIVSFLTLILASIWVGLSDKIDAYKREMRLFWNHAVLQWKSLDKIKLDPDDIYMDKETIYDERAKNAMPIVRRLHAVKKRRDGIIDSRVIRRFIRSNPDIMK